MQKHKDIENNLLNAEYDSVTEQRNILTSVSLSVKIVNSNFLSALHDGICLSCLIGLSPN